MVVAPLSAKHLAEIELAVERALAQWVPHEPREPAHVVSALERVLLFLRQNGRPSAQARQVTSLALAWGAQVARAAEWRWMSVSADGSVNPALVSRDGTRACLVVDVVTAMVLKQGASSLTGLYRQLSGGALPAGECVELVHRSPEGNPSP